MAVLNRLCTPAFLYAVVHIALLAMTLLRHMSRGTLFNSDVLSKLLFNVIMIVAWVFVLNFCCRKGLGPISWLLVLAPFIAMLGFSRRSINLNDPNPLSGFM